MAVKDFMTKRVVYVSPETTVAVAADIMREKGLRRLPVIEHDKIGWAYYRRYNGGGLTIKSNKLVNL